MSEVKKPDLQTDNTVKAKDHYNKTGFYAFLLTLVFSCFWVSYFLFVNNKIDLAEISESVEESAPEGLTSEEQSRPWVSTANLVSHGAKIYQAQCALCHGAKGLGDGTPGLIPPPRDLVEGKWRLGGTPQALFSTLQKGIEGGSMVSFKHLPKLDRWALVHYVRSITQNKISYSEEELEEYAKTAL